MLRLGTSNQDIVKILQDIGYTYSDLVDFIVEEGR